MNFVIPTYEKHFIYNFNFLNSFNEFCLDKENVNIYLIGRNNSKEYLTTMAKNFNLNVFIYDLLNIFL